MTGGDFSAVFRTFVSSKAQNRFYNFIADV